MKPLFCNALEVWNKICEVKFFVFVVMAPELDSVHLFGKHFLYGGKALNQKGSTTFMITDEILAII